MSAAAEQAVAGYAESLRLTPSARALLHAIATVIPDGETMTAPLRDGDLARRTGYDRRSIISARDSLVTERVIRAVGGGRGRVASYELLLLPGAGADRSLPFLDLVRPRRAAPPHPTPLLDVPLDDDDASSRDSAGADLRASAVRSFFTRCAARLRQRVIFFHRLRNQHVIFFHTLVTSLRQRVIFFHRFVTFGHAPYDPVLAEDGARARGSTYTPPDHVHTQIARAEKLDDPTRPHPWHAWCAGRVHVPRDLHDELLRRHPRHADESDAAIEAALFAFYAATCAQLPIDEPIRDKNEFAFWRRMYAAAFGARAARDPPPVSITREDRARAAEILKLRFGWCPHDRPCASGVACVALIAADLARQRAAAEQAALEAAAGGGG